MVKLPPISEGTCLRAAEADPNDQRCLIENYPKERAIQLTHILPRSLSENGELVSDPAFCASTLILYCAADVQAGVELEPSAGYPESRHAKECLFL
jgi:hypothetical protein